MKCSLFDIESLSAQIENLRSLGPEQLDQTLARSGVWIRSTAQGLRRPADQGTRVSAAGKSGNRRPETFHFRRACSIAGAGTGFRSGVLWLEPARTSIEGRNRPGSGNGARESLIV